MATKSSTYSVRNPSKAQSNAWIVNDLITKRQFDFGIHPERYFKLRYTRHRRPPGYIRNVRKVKTIRSFYTPTSSKLRTNFEKIEYRNLTESELRAEISIIFNFAEKRKEAERLRWKPPIEEFLKQGWKEFFVPRRYSLPITPGIVQVPLGRFTFYETSVKDEITASQPPPPKLFSRKNYHITRKTVLYFWDVYFGTYSKYPKVYFARPMDFTFEEIDITKKNYIYPFDPEEEFEKSKVPTLYDKCTYCMFAKISNLRKYTKEYGDKYRYIQTYLMDKTPYPRWSETSIDFLRKIFIQCDPDLTGFIDFEEMCVLLNSIKDKSTDAERKKEFKQFLNTEYESDLTPKNKIEFEEFLRVTYNLLYKDKDTKKNTNSSNKSFQSLNYPWEKRPKTPKTFKKMKYSFRKSWQYISIATGNSLIENIACAMY